MDISKLNHDELTLLEAGACTMAPLASQHLNLLHIILMAPIYGNSFCGLLDIKGSKPFFMLIDLIIGMLRGFGMVFFCILCFPFCLLNYT